MLLLTNNFQADAQIQQSFNHPHEVQQIIKEFNRSLNDFPMAKEGQILKTYIYHCPVDDNGRELYVQMDLVKGAESFSAKKIKLTFPNGDRPIVLYGKKQLQTGNQGILYLVLNNEITDLEIWPSEKANKKFGAKGVMAGVIEIKLEETNTFEFEKKKKAKLKKN